MAEFDYEKYRLRNFLNRLVQAGEVEVHNEHVELIDLAALIEATPKATWFKDVGPEHFEMTAGIMASRKRLAMAFGCSEAELQQEYMRRLATPQEVAEVSRVEAPVQQVVITGDDIDLAKLPFYLQHELDGATYLSAAMDFTVDPKSGKPNVGFRRLMLKGKRTMRANLTQISDLRRIYLEAVERKETLPVSFVVGAHPLVCLGAAIRLPVNEFELVAQLRGETMPMVKSVSNDIPVPADAELVIEGYFDERGYAEIEGPYGELYGLYGPMHPDPLFHVTAITMRKDVLHHTLLHGGQILTRNDAAHMSGLDAEVKAWNALKDAGLDVQAVHAPPSAVGMHHIRAAIRQKQAGDGRKAVEALLKRPLVKHVFVVDEDIDVFSDGEVERAMCTRFRVGKDLIVEHGHRTLTMDPTSDHGEQSVAGFDMTRDLSEPDDLIHWSSYSPRISGGKKAASVREALESGPKFFMGLMDALGDKDGRAIAVELGTLQDQGIVGRKPNGEWFLEGK